MKDFVIINTEVYPPNPLNKVLVLNAKWSIIIYGDYKDYSSEETRVIVIVDYIGSRDEILNTLDHDIPKLRGNFYAIVFKGENIRVYNSSFSMLPIYYTKDKQMIASSISLIEENSNKEFSLDKKFILENLLFNYGFFNRTNYKEIKLVPSNNYVSLHRETVIIVKHFTITDLFVKNPVGGKKAVNELSNLFVKTTEHYFPNTNFNIAFTSGFDGRTLVSCGMHHQKKFNTFSFGRPENDDVAIPKNNADELNIPYQYFNLGTEKYIKASYLENATEFTASGYLGNGFLYAHFPYSVKKLQQENSNYLISGACGSELFRALHTTGAVTSADLAHVFSIEDEQELREKLRTSKTLEVLKTNDFLIELEELISEIVEYKKQLPKTLTLNQQFYVFVFEEIFRKFFGQWVVAQQQYTNVRTPFLDFNFVKALLQTKYAGANNDFFTDNPIKRMKGQYIYADIIKKTNSIIYHQITGKGYAPRDVRNSLYRANIILPFIKKKFRRKVTKTYLDNLGIISGVKENKEILKEIVNNSALFKKKKLLTMLDNLSGYTPEKERDTLLMSLSIIYNHKKKERKEVSENKLKQVCYTNN